MRQLINKLRQLVENDKFLIVVALLISLAVRFITVNNNSSVFFFDQARDAYISRQILEKNDIKIIGPSASGTEDQFYHGVLYYYLIGPVYTLTGGDPALVSFWLGALNSLTVIPLYILAYSLTKKRKIAFTSSLFFALSAQSSLVGTWLSNPSFAPLTITCFYLFFWKAFFEKKYKLLPLVTFFMGLTNQSILFSLYLFLSLGIGGYYLWIRKETKQIPRRTFLVSLLTYILSISTMILAELMLFKSGIVSLNKLVQISTVQEDPYAAIEKIVSTYINTLSWNILPTFLTISALVSIYVMYVWYKKNSNEIKLFSVIWLFSPLLLLLIQTRSNAHTLIGLAPLLYIALAFALFQLAQYRMIILTLLIVLFTWSNVSQIQRYQSTKKNTLTVQQGAFLKDELEMIDYMYSRAEKKEFSISTLTNPLGYNTTWAYLFDWYGKKKYGYVPQFYGPDQNGIFAGELLKNTKSALPLHFSIYEPVEGLSEGLVLSFTYDQNLLISAPTDSRSFGALKVEERHAQTLRN